MRRGFVISLSGGRELIHFPQSPGAHSVRLAPRYARGAFAPSGLLRSPALYTADTSSVAGNAPRTMVRCTGRSDGARIAPRCASESAKSARG